MVAVSRVYLEYLGDAIEVPLGETVLGRDVGCAFRFNDPSVSRRHLRLVRREGELFLEDLRSSNGTLLNGRSVTAPLHARNGDLIVIGSRHLIVRIALNEGDEPSTLKIKEVSAAVNRRPTFLLPTPVPPPATANQRCPQCGAAVSSDDEECSGCHYRWGDFRPANPTNVNKPSPLANRRHERRPVELRLIYASSELEIETTSRNLSQGGVFVCSEVLDPLGTECSLTTLIDGGPPLQLRGIVRRVVERKGVDHSETGMGVEFVDVGAEERAWLTTTVERLEQEEAARLDDLDEMQD